MKLQALIVQVEGEARQQLAGELESRAYKVWQYGELAQALNCLEENQVNLVFLDLHHSALDWQSFLRTLKSSYPKVKVILTSNHPNLQRELQAQELGYTVFLREPFERRWVDLALERIDQADQERVKKEKELPQNLPYVRFPVQLKITLPYLILAVLFALATAYIISQVVFDSVQERYFNQLVASSKQGSDWVVREEDRLLSTLRLVANTQGVAEALMEEDSERLRTLILPLAMNTNEEAVDILDLSGVAQLSLRRNLSASVTDFSSGRGETLFQSSSFVRKVLNGISDSLGDKYAGLAQLPEGHFLFVSGPIYSADGNLVGVVLVGKSLKSMVAEVQSDTLANVSLYDTQGNVIVSTIFNNDIKQPLSPDLVSRTLSSQGQTGISRDLTIDSVQYTELLGVWEARSGQLDLGLIGTSLPQAYLVQTSQVTRIQVFVLSLAAILLIIVIGVYLANLITRPLLRLVAASTEVARGNLDIKVESKGNDEVAILAHSFNSMIAGLQEGSIYRDLLGRSVSPEVREQLRHTFSSGNLRLEGQETVATVMLADIRDFTAMAEKSGPAAIFEWLNEYFAIMLPAITENSGVVNKLDGDAVLAFFGILPRFLAPQMSAYHACCAALEMEAAISQLNEKRIERGDLPFITGIGIHTGLVMAGGLGTRDRIHYTIIGDTVNTAQRIEGLTRELFADNGVLMTQATLDALAEKQNEFIVREIGFHSVKGKEEKIMVYQLAGLASQLH